jgi:hypothetical protein
MVRRKGKRQETIEREREAAPMATAHRPKFAIASPLFIKKWS